MLTILPAVQFLMLFYKTISTSEGPELHHTEMPLGGLVYGYSFSSRYQTHHLCSTGVPIYTGIKLH